MGKRFTERMSWLRSAWWSASAREGRHARPCRGLNAWIGLIASMICGPVVASAAPSLLPAESNYRVKWSQADTTPPVTNWDIEVTPVRNAGLRFVARAQAIPELSCWKVNVPVGEPAVVRIRSVTGAVVSSWSLNTTVPKTGSSYLVKWFQPTSTPSVVNWDLEITPIRDANARFVVGAQVSPQLSCWALNVPVSEPSAVRIRPVSGTTVAAWSSSTTVPEPGVALSSIVGFGCLAAVASRSVRRKRALRPRP